MGGLSGGRLMMALEYEVAERSGVPMEGLIIFREFLERDFELTMFYCVKGETVKREATLTVPAEELDWLGEEGIMELAIATLRENYLNRNR